MAIATLCTGASGLNVKVDQVRVSSNETGIVEMPKAINIDLDQTGRITRRRGFITTSRMEAITSLWAEGSDCFYTSGECLYRLNPDMSRIGLRSGMTAGIKTDFCKVNDRTYYTNGKENGYIVGDTSYVWKVEDYVGPVTWRRFSDPPIGSLLEYFSGRIFIAQGNILWFSEPFAYNWFCLSDSFVLFQNKINMIKAVDDGVFVGLEDSVWFFAGTKPTETTIKRICSFPAIVGTGKKVDGSLLGMEGIQGSTVLWTSKKGICLGTNGGQFKNITEKKHDSLKGRNGSSLVFEDKYITTLW